jgi:hypothetical protein
MSDEALAPALSWHLQVGSLPGVLIEMDVRVLATEGLDLTNVRVQQLELVTELAARSLRSLLDRSLTRVPVRLRQSEFGGGPALRLIGQAEVRRPAAPIEQPAMLGLLLRQVERLGEADGMDGLGEEAR